jgi:hypothetical protein
MLRLFALFLLILLIGGPLLLLSRALEDLPRTIGSTSLSVDDVENVQRLLRENDPRRLGEGERTRVRLTERELNLLLRYALPERASAQLRLTNDLLSVAASAPVPSTPLGDYLNLEMVLAPAGRAIEPIAVSMGEVRLPRWCIRGLMAVGGTFLERAVPEYDDILGAISELRVDESALSLVYEWRPELVAALQDRGQQLAMPDDELRRAVLDYYAVIAASGVSNASNVSLSSLLRRLFREAERRSQAGADPREEHRALLLALGIAVRGSDPNRLRLEGEVRLPVLKPPPVTLRGRRDLAQHFVISAALAAGASTRLADAIGVFKELSDSRGGSGLSFPDLLADRAGVVLAERATGDYALRIQRLLAASGDETLFMPPVDRLPEGLQDAEFRLRYEDIDTAAFDRIRNEVERRIEALALYRPRASAGDGP